MVFTRRKEETYHKNVTGSLDVTLFGICFFMTFCFLVGYKHALLKDEI